MNFSAFLTTRSGGPAEDRAVMQAMIEHTGDEFQLLVRQYQTAIEREHAANLEAEKLSGVQLRPPPNALDPGWQKTWCVWGSASTVSDHVGQAADLGIGNILGGFLGGPLTAERQKLTKRSLELYANEVMPKFQRR